ncbi:hypothetical protein WR25_23235 [Diploscapter pachys]|uniref:Uncharacterized protein n=1 Tax=Diploscapter pachys TaxID=2018661 RepID=A0A2A2JVR9_9BILA|nr:hypothetical protein WR25_23235 [Diploscapter pachys]
MGSAQVNTLFSIVNEHDIVKNRPKQISVKSNETKGSATETTTEESAEEENMPVDKDKPMVVTFVGRRDSQTLPLEKLAEQSRLFRQV